MYTYVMYNMTHLVIEVKRVRHVDTQGDRGMGDVQHKPQEAPVPDADDVRVVPS